jgi:hypothetical protein
MQQSSSTSSFRAWFWLVVGVALAAVGGFAAASEYLVRTQIEPVDAFEQSIGVFQRARERGVRNAAFGDSIPARGLLFAGDDTVNLAFPGERPKRTAIKLEAYFRDIRPGRVILPANANMLKRPLDDTRGYEDIFTRTARKPVRLMEDRHRGYLYDYWRTLLVKRRFESSVRLAPLGGLLPVDPQALSSFATGGEAVRRREAEELVLRDLPPDEEDWFAQNPNLAIMRDMLGFLRRRGAEVCLVRFPTAPEYRRLAAQHPAFERASRAFERLAAEFGVPLKDYRERYDNPRLFENPNHINHLAAPEFARTALADCFG